jgi:hypothetical protein
MRQVTFSQQTILRKALSIVVLSLVPLAVFGRIVPDAKPMDMSSATGNHCSVVCVCMLDEAQAPNATQGDLAVASGVGSESAIPAKLFLDQNYPNPFNPSTIIRYGLPAGANVKLTIHTLLGNEIKAVINSYQDAGVYTIDLAADDLPSGVYFYRLQTELGTLTRRMTISK